MGARRVPHVWLRGRRRGWPRFLWSSGAFWIPQICTLQASSGVHLCSIGGEGAGEAVGGDERGFVPLKSCVTFVVYCVYCVFECLVILVVVYYDSLNDAALHQYAYIMYMYVCVRVGIHTVVCT